MYPLLIAATRPRRARRSGSQRAAPLPVSPARIRRGAIVWSFLICMGLSALTAWAWSAWFDGHLTRTAAESGIATAIVARGPLAITLTERGELQSANNTTIRHRVDRGGTLTLLNLVPEGSWVEPGDVIAELDASRIRREAQYYQIWMYYFEAYRKTAEARLAIQRLANESLVANALHRARMADLDLEKYRDGDYVQRKHKFAGEILLAQENVHAIEERLRSLDEMLRKGYARTDEIRADEFALAKAQALLARAEEKMHILEEFTHRRDLADKQARAKRYRDELERVQLRAEMELGQKELDVIYGKRYSAYYRYWYEHAQRRIEACVIRAPSAGAVVYANGNIGPSGPTIYEGARVWEGQPLVHLPDIREMQVNARIHESKILQVRPGLHVTVHVDALGGETFEGIVDKVAVVPLSASWPNLNLKEYATTIRIRNESGDFGALRPGMTAQVAIHADPLESTLQAPIQACAERGGRTFAWVQDDLGQVQRREVQLGFANDSAAQVVSGLAAGERVVLRPRTDLPQEIAQLHEDFPIAHDFEPEVAPDTHEEVPWELLAELEGAPAAQ